MVNNLHSKVPWIQECRGDFFRQGKPSGWANYPTSWQYNYLGDETRLTFLGTTAGAKLFSVHYYNAVIPGHKYLSIYRCKVDVTSNVWIYPTSNLGNLSAVEMTTEYKEYGIFTTATTGMFQITCRFYSYSTQPRNIFIKYVMFFDLTAMYGEGNEPSTLEAFRAQYPFQYYPTNY